MSKTTLTGNIILPDKILTGGAVIIENESILDILPQEDTVSITGTKSHDYGDNFISPGFIDLHTHGAMGQDIMDCDSEGLEQIARHQARCGVTGFLGATVSATMESLFATIEFVKQAAQPPVPSEILGIHIEGPYLSKEMRGAHNPSFIKEMETSEIEPLMDALEGLSVIISMAPEVDNNMSFIRLLKERGLVVSIGHSDASYEQALESFKEGISHATHLFNAMSGYNHREPGVVGAVFDSPEVTTEIIADGVHLHPSAVRLTLSRKGSKGICLITDSIKASGMGDGIYSMENLKIEVAGGVARLQGSDILAGSTLTMNKAVKNVAEWTHLPIFKVINMASLNPARVLGLDNKIGSIEKGKQADLVVFDREINIRKTIRKGKFISE